MLLSDFFLSHLRHVLTTLRIQPSIRNRVKNVFDVSEIKYTTLVENYQIETTKKQLTRLFPDKQEKYFKASPIL